MEPVLCQPKKPIILQWTPTKQRWLSISLFAAPRPHLLGEPCRAASSHQACPEGIDQRPSRDCRQQSSSIRLIHKNTYSPSSAQPALLKAANTKSTQPPATCYCNLFHVAPSCSIDDYLQVLLSHYLFKSLKMALITRQAAAKSHD